MHIVDKIGYFWWQLKLWSCRFRAWWEQTCSRVSWDPLKWYPGTQKNSSISIKADAIKHVDSLPCPTPHSLTWSPRTPDCLSDWRLAWESNWAHSWNPFWNGCPQRFWVGPNTTLCNLCISMKEENFLQGCYQRMSVKRPCKGSKYQSDIIMFMKTYLPSNVANLSCINCHTYPVHLWRAAPRQCRPWQLVGMLPR